MGFYRIALMQFWISGGSLSARGRLTNVPLWVIRVIPAIPACPVRPKSGHSANARARAD